MKKSGNNHIRNFVLVQLVLNFYLWSSREMPKIHILERL